MKTIRGLKFKRFEIYQEITFIIDKYAVMVYNNSGDKRIHFSSAMTMLGKQGGVRDTSYLDIVDFIKAYGMNVKADLIELWR